MRARTIEKIEIDETCALWVVFDAEFKNQVYLSGKIHLHPHSTKQASALKTQCPE